MAPTFRTTAVPDEGGAGSRLDQTQGSSAHRSGRHLHRRSCPPQTRAAAHRVRPRGCRPRSADSPETPAPATVGAAGVSITTGQTRPDTAPILFPLRLSVQVCQDGKNAAVVVVGGRHVLFGEDVVDVLVHGL